MLVLCVGGTAQDKPAGNPISAAPKLPPPASLPHGDWFFQADHQSSEGSVKKLQGHAEAESAAYLVRADEIEYDDDTREVVAHGHVYFHSFERNEQLWCDQIGRASCRERV